MKKNIFLLCILGLQHCKPSSPQNEIAQQVANENGLGNFNKVKMLEFVFHAQKDTAAASSRHWQWFPKTNEVIFITDTSNTRFKRGDTTTQDLKKLNARFTNDEYWLLFPYHLMWDSGVIISDSSMQPAPISGKSMRKLVLKYNDKDGFTPADIYEIYLDDNKRIQEWAYHKSGATEPSLVTTWEDYKNFNELSLSQEHKSKDGKFRLWFTGIQVKNN